MKNARETACDILCDIDKGTLSNVAYNNHIAATSLSKSDRDFVKALVSGTLAHLTSIDSIISANSKAGSKLKPIIRNVLRISIYQLQYMSDIPVSAICNEAVKIVERRKIYGLKGFVNAVLRNLCETLPRTNEDKTSDMPAFIKEIIGKRAGEMADKVIEHINKPSPLVCRFNLGKCTKESILQSLSKQNIDVKPIPYLNNGYILENYNKVSDIKAFNDGYIQIQGASSILACEILNPIKGSRILDICAAPGGKSIALADMMNGTGLVVARDLTEKKIKLINQNAERTGIGNINAQVYDATCFSSEDVNMYDYVLCDLPCSGLGTIGHKIEVRYKIDKDKINELALLQRNILKNAVKYLKSGGILMYSTCTISYEENEENFEYIKNELGLTPVPVSCSLSDRHESSKFGHIQLLPYIDDECDGFFISLFKKENNE